MNQQHNLDKVDNVTAVGIVHDDSRGLDTYVSTGHRSEADMSALL